MNMQTTLLPVENGSIRLFLEQHGIAYIRLHGTGRVLVVLADGRAAAGPEVSVALEKARKPDAVRVA